MCQKKYSAINEIKVFCLRLSEPHARAMQFSCLFYSVSNDTGFYALLCARVLYNMFPLALQDIVFSCFCVITQIPLYKRVRRTIAFYLIMYQNTSTDNRVVLFLETMTPQAKSEYKYDIALDFDPTYYVIWCQIPFG